jgi:predicted transcriptional regulator
MSPRRSKLEIPLKILASVKQGVDKPTRIMYAANMSWKPVQRILAHLVKQGLLLEVLNTESMQSKRRYLITEKGEQVLDYFEKANDIMPLEDVYAGI